MTPLDQEIQQIERAIRLLKEYSAPKYTRAYYSEQVRLKNLEVRLAYWTEIKRKLQLLDECNE